MAIKNQRRNSAYNSAIDDTKRTNLGLGDLGGVGRDDDYPYGYRADGNDNAPDVALLDDDPYGYRADSEAKKVAYESALASRPAWDGGKYGAMLDDAVNQILNRKPFQYDLNGDMLYQQYKDQYLRQGNLAMQDTMGKAAALTGGYGNSYAQTVGQQTYNGFIQELNDRIPELYGLALDKYKAENERLGDNYSVLRQAYGDEYDRYADQYSQWKDDVNRSYTEYDDSMSRALSLVNGDNAEEPAYEKYLAKEVESQILSAIAASEDEESRDKAITRIADAYPNYRREQIFEFANSNRNYKGESGEELPITQRTFKKVKDTHNGLGGVDNNDVVEDQYGNQYRIDELPEDIRMALTRLKKDETWTGYNTK